jgi:ABC-2 type transport system ATP-binding protein
VEPAGGREDAECIRVTEVSKAFGRLTAVSKVSFRLEKGLTLGLLGSDGAGKTTLLRMIAGMVRPTTGRILVEGLDVVRQRAQIKERIGYMPQRFGLYPDLSVAENLDFFMDIYGIVGAERRRRRERYLGFSNLLPFLERHAGALSGGMKQKLGLACVLVHQPDVLVLDEPTNGVDPVSRREFWDILGAMKADGMTILVATAYMDEGDKCDRLLLMHDARILESASPERLRAGFENLEQAVIHRIRTADPELAGETFGA